MTVQGLPAVDYTFDAANRLTRVAKGGLIVDQTYDELNRRTVLAMPGGVTVNTSYDDLSRITGITYKDGTTTLGNLAYSYDTPGRLAKTTGTWARTGLPTAVASMTYNAGNRMITRGGATLTYDDNGNLVNDTTSTYTWNARGQLANTTGLATFNYSYDGLGRRTRKTVGGTTTTDYVYQGAQVTAEKQNGAFSATLLTGLGVDEVFVRNGSEGIRDLLPDAQGTTVALSDGTTTIPTSYSYEAFGRTTTTGTANSNPYQYAGREADGPGFYYNRARYYSATIGRFISEDPIGYAGGDTNLYSYVANSPTNATDPSGLCAVGAIIGAGEAIARKKSFWGVVKSAATGCLSDLAFGGTAKVLKFAKGLFPEKELGRVFRHYTDDVGRAGIETSGTIRPGLDGRVYVTPTRYTNGPQAQAELALSRSPTGYFRDSEGTPSRTARSSESPAWGRAAWGWSGVLGNLPGRCGRTQVGPDRTVKRPFLVVYDYGSGGVWAFVVAQSREEIETAFPELNVVSEVPSWMTLQEQDRVRRESMYDLESDRVVGLLAEILDSRGQAGD